MLFCHKFLGIITVVRLVISVQPGGCNGFEYKFNVEKYEKDFKKDLDIKNNDPKEGECHLAATECKKGHLIYLKDMLLILIDAVSLKMINGSTLDYTKDLNKDIEKLLKHDLPLEGY